MRLLRMEVRCVLLCLVAITLDISMASPLNFDETQCKEYAYCEGESFPNRLRVLDRVISCAEEVTAETLRENCCLPQERHLVCYNIKIEGERLNYSNDSLNILDSTDFSNLCQMMLELQGQRPGNYNSADLQDGGGYMAFLYGKWWEAEPSEKHIAHLACGVSVSAA